MGSHRRIIPYRTDIDWKIGPIRVRYCPFSILLTNNRPALAISPSLDYFPQISPKLYIYIHACSAIQFPGNEIFSTLMIIYTPLIIRECSPYLIWNLYILFPISLNTSCRRYNSYSSAFPRRDGDEVIDLQFTKIPGDGKAYPFSHIFS